MSSPSPTPVLSNTNVSTLVGHTDLGSFIPFVDHILPFDFSGILPEDSTKVLVSYLLQ